MLFNKHLTKKRKTWSDGFVSVNEQQQAVLTDEEGAHLASSRITFSPADAWTSSTEGAPDGETAGKSCAIP